MTRHASAAPSTARAESVAFSPFADESDDEGFMDYTDDAFLPAVTGRQAGAGACAATSPRPHPASRGGSSAPAFVVPAPSTSSGNIIMRDGGICDPIRHMGC